MTAEELLRIMRAVLTEEREGILRFDASLVARANATKELVLRLLRETPIEERAPLLAVLDEVQPDLRCNQILLTHAHASLRDMQEREVEREPRTSTVVPLLKRKAG